MNPRRIPILLVAITLISLLGFSTVPRDADANPTRDSATRTFDTRAVSPSSARQRGTFGEVGRFTTTDRPACSRSQCVDICEARNRRCRTRAPYCNVNPFCSSECSSCSSP